jgi:hypothetical protein
MVISQSMIVNEIDNRGSKPEGGTGIDSVKEQRVDGSYHIVKGVISIQKTLWLRCTLTDFE